MILSKYEKATLSLQNFNINSLDLPSEDQSCVPPIAATQVGWYLYDKQTGLDFGMIVGVSSVIYAAWLLYNRDWRDED